MDGGGGGGGGRCPVAVCNLHKATHFLISSTTFIPSGSTSINIAALQVLPKKQNKIHFCSDC